MLEKDLLRSAARRVCEKDLRSAVANVTHLSSRGPFAQSSRSRALHDSTINKCGSSRPFEVS